MATGRDAVLAGGAQISGFVTDQGGGALTGAEVTLYQLVGGTFQAIENESSRDTGLYFFEGLAPGTYRVGVDYSWQGFVDEFWNDKATLASATDVVLGVAGAASGTDFVLQKAATTPPMVNTSPPSIAGMPQVGRVLTAGRGVVADGGGVRVPVVGR